MTASFVGPDGQSRMARRIGMLLAVAVFINYVDRGNLATASPLVQRQFHLSASQLGILLSSFYWTYAISQIPAGWLAERFRVERVVAVGFAIWSVATLLTGLAGGFMTLLALRLMLGLGESVAFPCSSKMLATHVGIDKRGRANGAISMGLAAGPAFGTFVGGMILVRFGWRPLFISLGALSLLWLWPWITGPVRNLSRTLAPDPVQSPSYGEIIRRRASLGAALGHFCCNYGFYIVINWLPLYLVQERGFSIAQMSVLGGTIYLMQAGGAFAGGWALDRWIRAGATPDRAYKTMICASQTTTAMCLVGAIWAPPVASSVFLLLAGACFGPGSTTLYAIGQTLAGPPAAGRWMAFQNGVGNLAGILSPAITGFLVDRTGHFYSAFALAIAIMGIGVASWIAVVPRIAPLDWTSHPRGPSDEVPVAA
jgi:MFS family permease